MRLRPVLLVAMAAYWGLVAQGQTAPATARATYNVREFGAVGDGTTKDTRAFQKALDTCAVSGGGDVVVSAGNYLIGSIQLGNRTMLRLEKGAIKISSCNTKIHK